MGGGRRWIRRAAGLLLAAVLVVVAAGCGATATVAVRVAPDGSGTVGVRVVVDRAALAEIGGLGQLRTADLAAAGWSVTGPQAVAGGGAAVQASHRFAGAAELSSLLRAVAHTRLGGRDHTVFTLRLRTTRTSRLTTTVAAGRVDLSCGLGCFGDAGLRRDYGSAVGAVGVGGTGAAARDLHVLLTLQLPGRIGQEDASSRRGRVLTWDVPLGRSAPVAATTTIAVAVRSHSALPVVGSAAATLAVALVAVGVVVVRRRRRGRRP